MDTDGDERGRPTVDTVATWPYGGNFHEFAFGLLYQDGFFYVNLSVVDQPTAARPPMPQPAANRGTTIKVNKDDRRDQLRRRRPAHPERHRLGPGGRHLRHRQPGWLAARVEAGAHQAGPVLQPLHEPGRARSTTSPVTQPVLWMPQNEIANSPSTPLLLDQRPLRRPDASSATSPTAASSAPTVEKVNGEYQGAVFRLTQGLEAGVTEVNLGPDGAIYVGGLGAGGNWGQEGKLTYGLQKLTPNGDHHVRDHGDAGHRRRLRAGVHRAGLGGDRRATWPRAYQVEQWRYVPTSSYGGPEGRRGDAGRDRSATLAADGRNVRLRIPGLKAGRVVHVRSPRPFTSADGEQLWNTEAWYTLNAIPAGRRSRRPSYEAEEASLPAASGIGHRPRRLLRRRLRRPDSATTARRPGSPSTWPRPGNLRRGAALQQRPATRSPAPKTAQPVRQRQADRTDRACPPPSTWEELGHRDRAAAHLRRGRNIDRRTA